MTALEKPKHPMIALRDHLESRSAELHHALPKHIPPDRFIRVVLTAVQMNLDLLACDRQSLWNACMRAAQSGLLPDGQEGAIVPFGKTAQWMPMVGGLLKRFRNSGQFRSIAANIVRENESFEYWIDEKGEHLNHHPGDGDGKVIKAYAMATTKDGGVMIRVMSVKDIDKRRNASRAKNSPLWNDWYEEACLKTVLRNLAKRLPMSSDLDDLVRQDDALYDFSPDKSKSVVGVENALEHFSQAETPAPEKNSGTDAGLEPVHQEQLDMDDDTNEGGDTEQQAFDRGQFARAEGLQRRALPPEYRPPSAASLAKAWQKGWDSA